MRVTKSVLLSGLLVMAACGDDDPTGAADPVVSAIEIDPETVELLVGDTVRLSAYPMGTNGEVVEGAAVTWSADPATRLALTPAGFTGRITALRAGPATITATAGGRSAEASLSILNPAPALSAISPAGAHVGDDDLVIAATGSGFTHDSRVQWNGVTRPTTFVDASEVRATISAVQLATVGVAEVRVVTPAPGGGVSATLAFAVQDTTPPPPPGPVHSVELDVDSIDLAEGATRQLVATARNAQGQIMTGLGMTWTVTPAGNASVGALGLVSGVRTGRAVVTVTVHGKQASAVVRVTADYDYDLVYSAWKEATQSGAPYRLDISDPSAAAVEITLSGVEVGMVSPSPDGQRYAFIGTTALQGYGLYVAGTDGSGLLLLAPIDPDVAICGHVAWRPDGQRLAYVCGFTTPEQHVVTIATSGTEEPLVVTQGLDGRHSWPTWSPAQPGGGYRIAWSRTVLGEPHIFTMNEDGSDVVQLTNGSDDEPSWSPDGTTIAFQRSGAAIFGDIWLVDATGANARGLLLVALAGPQQRPTWSPDGQLIAFTSRHETYGAEVVIDQIYTARPDGSGLARRTDDATAKGSPAWLAR